MTVSQPTTTIAAQPKIKKKSQLRQALDLVFASRIATIGMCMVMFWVVLAFISLFWTPADPTGLEFGQNLPPNSENWLGTDNLGRDTLSRLMTGGQVILLKTRFPAEWNLPISAIPGGVAIWGCVRVTYRWLDIRA